MVNAGESKENRRRAEMRHAAETVAEAAGGDSFCRMSAAIDLEHMTQEEKLGLMERLWDSLAVPGDVPVYDWHKRVLDERKQLALEGQAKFTAWSLAKERIIERTR